MKCEDVKSLLDPLVDNELPTETVAIAMKHIADCVDCQDDWDSRVKLKDRFKTLSNKVSSPVGAIDRINTLIDNESKQSVSFLSPRLKIAIAASAIALLGVLVFYQLNMTPAVTAHQLAENYSKNIITMANNKNSIEKNVKEVSDAVGFHVTPLSINGWELASVDSFTPAESSIRIARLNYESLKNGQVQRLSCYQSAKGIIKPDGLVERTMKGKKFCCGRIGKLSLVYWPIKDKDHVLVSELSEKAITMIAMGV